jgi:hypothetical protein
MTRHHISESMPCPYCGGIGYHKRAGAGACPGLINPNPPIVLTGSSAFAVEIAALKALCARAADALEGWIGDLPASDKHLVQELRKAAK